MGGANDFEPENARPISTSAQMDIAKACLGGERQWVGNVRGPFGLIKRQFSIQSNGIIQGGDLCFFETVCFDDGETQKREWRLVDARGGLLVKGPDVEQIEPSQLANENALILVYKIKLGTMRFRYHDLFRLHVDGGVENIGQVTFGGIRVMRITAASPAERALAA